MVGARVSHPYGIDGDEDVIVDGLLEVSSLGTVDDIGEGIEVGLFVDACEGFTDD